MKKMSKIIKVFRGIISIIIILSFVFNMNYTYANNLDLSSQINNAKIVAEYPNDSNVDIMDTVIFGNYSRNDIASQPIEWIVLEKDSVNSKALLLSKYILDFKPFEDRYSLDEYNNISDLSWENSSIRIFLNNVFYNKAFDNIEKAKILSTYVVNAPNEKYGTSSGSDTFDNVFLLSIDEVKKCFAIENTDVPIKKAISGYMEYAVSGKEEDLNRSHDHNGMEKKYKSETYWLRSAGKWQKIADINYNGIFGISGIEAFKEHGIRPAIWVNY